MVVTANSSSNSKVRGKQEVYLLTHQIFKMQHAYKLRARTNLQPFSHSNDDFYKIVKLINQAFHEGKTSLAQFNPSTRQMGTTSPTTANPRREFHSSQLSLPQYFSSISLYGNKARTRYLEPYLHRSH